MTVEEMSDAINAELDARGIQRRALRSAERVAGRAAVSEQVMRDHAEAVFQAGGDPANATEQEMTRKTGAGGESGAVV